MVVISFFPRCTPTVLAKFTRKKFETSLRFRNRDALPELSRRPVSHERATTIVRAYPYDTIVVYDSSLWRRSLIKAQFLLAIRIAYVAIGSEDFYGWIRFIKMNNRIQRTYRVNWPLDVSGTLVIHPVSSTSTWIEDDLTEWGAGSLMSVAGSLAKVHVILSTIVVHWWLFDEFRMATMSGWLKKALHDLINKTRVAQGISRRRD